MKALVKKERARGLWLEDVPEPEPGINDVKIAVKRTAICGTDLHIYKWDEWAQKTIPVPMVVGHEFVGEIVEVGDNVNDYTPGMIVSGEGHIVCGRCRNCMAGRRHLCPYHQRRRRQPARRLRRIYRHPERQCLAPCRRHRSRRRLDLRSVRQRHPHRLAMGSGRRGRADHRRRPDRRDGRRGLPPRRRAPRRHHRRQRLSPVARQEARRDPHRQRRQRKARRTSRRSSA